jgi:hypothetical protein
MTADVLWAFAWAALRWTAIALIVLGAYGLGKRTAGKPDRQTGRRPSGWDVLVALAVVAWLGWYTGARLGEDDACIEWEPVHLGGGGYCLTWDEAALAHPRHYTTAQRVEHGATIFFALGVPLALGWRAGARKPAAMPVA